MVGMGERLAAYEHDGLRFDVRDRGPEDGRVVVAQHGFPQTSASWEPVAERLVAGGCRVLAPDQRGYSAGARPRRVSAKSVSRSSGRPPAASMLRTSKPKSPSSAASERRE